MFKRHYKEGKYKMAEDDDIEILSDDDIETLRKILFDKKGYLKTQYAVIFGGFGGGLLLKAHKYSPEEQRSFIKDALKSTEIAIKLAELIA